MRQRYRASGLHQLPFKKKTDMRDERQQIPTNYNRIDLNYAESRWRLALLNSYGSVSDTTIEPFSIFHTEIPQHSPQPANLSSATMKLLEATLLLPDIFLFRPGLTLDLHHSTETLQPGDAIFSIGAYQLSKPFSKVPPTLSHLTYTLQRAGISIIGLRCSGLSIHGPGHSSTRLTLQLTGGSSSKQKGDRHISPALRNTTHIQVNPCACTEKKQKSRTKPLRKF